MGRLGGMWVVDVIFVKWCLKWNIWWCDGSKRKKSNRDELCVCVGVFEEDVRKDERTAQLVLRLIVTTSVNPVYVFVCVCVSI